MKIGPLIWVSTALLHKEQGGEQDFASREILERAREVEKATAQKPGVWQGICSQCVAVKPPNPGRHRYLHETKRGRRRLFRNGDPFHPKRNGKPQPEPTDVPEKYRWLLDWYSNEYDVREAQQNISAAHRQGATAETILKLMGRISREDADEMIRIIDETCGRVDASEW